MDKAQPQRLLERIRTLWAETRSRHEEEKHMARVIRFYIPVSYMRKLKKKAPSGDRGKLIRYYPATKRKSA